ncbi:uncharacterized protein GGS22DRAFT_159235 [Annulohypoxylon maeteangense]|uniref:uncharacterized protein n=1 Tax=Annulohypoxylon maeteangense TaxID=1927788 RepID=UPI002008E5C2|nr:uncharacterized protein GGS22DRAFT_159235 [Annulohypoxylon maeteangense]KAI0887033.1 hypothetical protein GGS22DRAFT_159235 [Annulohypoxylon maeteangense]
MIFRKSTIALCSSSNLPSFLSPPPHLFSGHCITSSCNSTTQRPQWSPNRDYGHIIPRKRCYATVSDGPKKPDASSPEHHAWPSSSQPTPYEIFDQQKTAPYSKSKFYELVKLYHPDRHHHTHHHSLSHSTRLERYRLIVAANQILSDPTKRRAYDLYGSGWSGVRSTENIYRSVDKSWRDMPGNASMNATWEDWERWYQERDGKKQEQQPIYMSNSLFASMLCMFVIVGSLGQAQRAGTNSMNLVEMKDKHHEAINHDMRKRELYQAPLSRGERVEHFLRQREGWALASSPDSSKSPTSDKE